MDDFNILGGIFEMEPLTVVGELHCGANFSQNPERNFGEIPKLSCAGVALLTPIIATAAHYGHIRAQLAKAGTPIPENDIWIAAHAMERQWPLAARDAHFDQVTGLHVLKR